MAYTFLYTNESEIDSPTIKFFSSCESVSEFTVTVLNDPAIKPFKMTKEQDGWRIVCDVCHKVRALEPVLIEAAAKFQRA